jgi:hypothetical protein
MENHNQRCRELQYMTEWYGNIKHFEDFISDILITETDNATSMTQHGTNTQKHILKRVLSFVIKKIEEALNVKYADSSKYVS